MMVRGCPRLSVLLLPVLLARVAGHGMLVEPPSRSSMWRYGFDTEPNYTDNELYCGGVTRQWVQNEGKCGVCGDPWDLPEPRPNEAGGKYGKGIIVRRYVPGELITISVKLTAAHMGWFEFRLCVQNNIHVPITHECLDQNLLVLDNGETRFWKVEEPRTYDIKARLPLGVTCSHCVIQWKYNTGNTWGIPEDGDGAEQFYGCADVAIGDEPTQSTTTTTQPISTTTKAPGGQTTITATPTTTAKPQTTTTAAAPSNPSSCHAIGVWEGDANMDQWCVDNCAANNCLPTHCACPEEQHLPVSNRH